MSQTPSNPAPAPAAIDAASKASAVSPRHYQALCGLSLAAIFFVQLQQSSLAMPISVLANLFVAFIGTLGILYRVRLSPIFVLIALAVPQLIEQHQANLLFQPDFRRFRFLDVADMLVCIAMLTYLIGQYRLHGLWFGVLPTDPRHAVGAARSEASLSAAELVGLIFPVPICALLAEFAALLLKQHWTLLDVKPREQQSLVVAWTLLAALFLGAQAFRYWKRLQMDHVSAQLLLQDVLWQETRREQRRINRWIVWKKLTSSEPEA